jgi:hypothetical protein
MATKLGPRQKVERQTHGQQLFINPIDAQISFSPDHFDKLVDTHGIKMTHFRGVPDPRGMLSRGDARSANMESRSTDGFLYKEAGEVTGFFSNNGNNMDSRPDFAIAHATAYLTFPRYYDNCEKPILLANWDRLFLKDIEIRVTTSQYLEANSTGIDKLHFPATCVEHLIDSYGNEYEETKDFHITNDGHIQWLTQYRPGWNAELGRGTVYAIRYRYTPFFIVNRLIHEIRVANVTNPQTSKRTLERMPYSVEVVREHVFLDTNRDQQSFQTDDPRYTNLPSASGSMGISASGALGT